MSRFASQPAPAPEPTSEATLELWSRPIVVLRKTVGGRTPAQRAEWMAEPSRPFRSRCSTAS